MFKLNKELLAGVCLSVCVADSHRACGREEIGTLVYDRKGAGEIARKRQRKESYPREKTLHQFY